MTSHKMFKPGTVVTMINRFDVAFPNKVIVKRDDKVPADQPHRYFIEPTDTPWYSFEEGQLFFQYGQEKS